MFLFLVSVFAALSISALCSLLEATLLSLTASQVAGFSSKRPRVAAIWQDFKSNIEKPIAVILIVNTAAHTVGATLAGAQFEMLFGEEWLVAFSLLFTYLMLQFTEILPKTLGVRYNVHLAPRIAQPLNWLVRTLTPVLWFIHFVNRPFERRRREADTTRQEIHALAATARLARLIDPGQERMIQVAAQLDEMWVRQIVTPRTEVVYLKLDLPIEQILDIVQHSPYTRLPLCDRDIDHVIGLVHIKDLFNHLDLVPGRFDLAPVEMGAVIGPEKVLAIPGAGLHVIGSGSLDLKKIRRNVLFVPEYTPVLKVLRQFQDSRQHFAVVVDEHGSTVGIVTLEDIIEEMVGDIQDEFDVPAPPLITKEGDTYRASGRLPIHELTQVIPAIEIDDEDVDTLGGYVAKVLGRMPDPGDVIPIGRFRAEVTAADGRRVQEVVLSPANLPEEGESMEMDGAEK